MTTKYSALAMCILLYFTLILVYPFFLKSKFPEEDLALLLLGSDAESQIALGLRLKLSEIRAADLELIPQISQSSKAELLQRSDELISSALKTQPEEVFQKIKGIGKNKALLLNDYLILQ